MLSEDHAVFEAPFRTARIGTMKVSSNGESSPIRFNEQSMKFTVKVTRDKKTENIKIKIPSDQLAVVKSYFGRGCPMLCVSTTPEYAAVLRDLLGMRKAPVPSPYYDPQSKIQAESIIVVVLDYDPIPYTVTFYFKKVLLRLCKDRNIEEKKLFSSLNHDQANSLLVDVSDICDRLEYLKNLQSPRSKLFGILQQSSSIPPKNDVEKRGKKPKPREIILNDITPEQSPTKSSSSKAKNRARKTLPENSSSGVPLHEIIEKAKHCNQQPTNKAVASGSDGLPTLKRKPGRPKIQKRTKAQKEYRTSHDATPVVGESLDIPFSTTSATTREIHLKPVSVLQEEDSSANDWRDLEKCICRDKQPDIVISGNEPLKCMGIDRVDSRLSKCIYPVRISMMMRASKTTPLSAFCDEHRERMLRHECCPGCGMFCAGGGYLICVADAQCPHRFHDECVSSLYKEKCCLHCMAPMSQTREVCIDPKQDSQLRAIIAKLDPTRVERNKKSRQRFARMGHKTRIFPSSGTGIVKTLGVYTVDSNKFPVGTDREALEEALCQYSESVPEKLHKTIIQITNQGDTMKLIQFICESGARELKSAAKISSVLTKPITCSNIPMVYLLLSTFADVDVTDQAGKTPLFYAEEQENVTLIDFLIKSGADIMVKDSEGMMCIHHAAKNGRIVSCAALIRHSREIVNTEDEGGWTPILWATEHKHVATAKYLEHFGADMMKTDNEGNTCLHWAALSGNLDLIIACLQKCECANIQNLTGDTALHVAARQDNVECVLCLINWGTDYEIKNALGSTALECAPAGSDSEALLKLKEQMMFNLPKLAEDRDRDSKLLSSDLSRGFENVPVSCINAVDDAIDPSAGRDGFQYVTASVQTSSDAIVKNALKCKIQSCCCYNECTDGSCLCSVMGGKCWYKKDGLLVDEFDFVDAPFIVECSETCWCPASCHNRVVQKGIKYSLQVHRTATMGWSVRALEEIPRGAFVCEYVGELISDADADIREDDSYLFDLENSDGEIFCIDARYYGNVSRFINHLCDRNLMPIRVFIDHHDKRFPRLAYFSTKDIAAGEELGFDYGDRFWDIKSRSFTCGCGSSRCKYSAEAYKLKKELESKKIQEENEKTDVAV